MKFGIRHQDTYSRGELILRGLFGWLYIAFPHAFLLIFLQIGAAIVSFISFWSILFTGNMPNGMFNYQLNLQKWTLRLNARLLNLSDGYPAFGLNSIDSNTLIELDQQESYNRMSLLARALFGFIYVYIPHMFCLFFLQIGAMFVRIIAFWAVLITGKYPKGMHNYMVGILRWSFRINIFMTYLTDRYPAFSMSGDEADFGPSDSGNLLDN